MAAFIPYDFPTPFVAVGNDGDTFIRTSDDPSLLPPDVISPIANYALYQEAINTPPYFKNRQLNPFDHPPSSHRFFPQSRAPLPSISTSLASPPSLSTLEHNYPSQQRFEPAQSPRVSVSTSSSFTSPPPPPLISPGLRLSSGVSTSTTFSQHDALLTPPLDDALPGSYVPFDLAKWQEQAASFQSTFQLTTPLSLSPRLASPSFTSHHADSSSFYIASPLPLTPPQESSPSLPTPPGSSQLQAAIFSGLANRRARGLRTLPSSIPTMATSTSVRQGKARATGGGSQSQYAREEVACTCTSCNISLGTLHLRGKGDALEVPVRADFECFDCRPDRAEESDTYENPEETVIGYEATLSACLDRAGGVVIDGRRRRMMRPTAKVRKPNAPRRDPLNDLLVCDVCRKDVAAGRLRSIDPNAALDFGIEVVCSHCASHYQRCSDCGSGGGPRLGIGKWRCKELFDEGRRCCSLSHARLGSITDLAYDAHSISSIPNRELDQLSETCFDFFRSSVLAALATPDVLDAPSPIATSYDQVERLAVDSWTIFEPFFRESLNPSKKRYIGLRWATPSARKKSKPTRKASGSSTSSAHDWAEMQDGSTQVALREGKKLTGFALMEVDLEEGLLYTPLTMPMGSVGETYDASTTLLQRMSQLIARETDAVNQHRRKEHLELYPPIREAWTAVLFSKDTRGANHLEARRGYVALEKYRNIYSSTAAHRFSSRLDALLPREVQPGWTIFVRPYTGAWDDWGEFVKSRSRRRSVTKSSIAGGPPTTRRRTARLAKGGSDDESDYIDEGTVSNRKRSRR